MHFIRARRLPIPAESSYIRFSKIASLWHNTTSWERPGEERAAEYLISKGYIIRDVNWRSGKMELDLVAYRDTTLVVVEVKTRQQSASFCAPRRR